MFSIDDRQKTYPTEDSQILFMIAEQILNFVCSLNRALKFQMTARTTEKKYPTIYFYSNGNDAKKKLPAFTEPDFYTSLVQQAISDDPTFDKKQELRQFNADIHRHSEITDDGETISKPDSAQILEKWSLQISAKTGIPLDRVKYAISTLHQGVGNNAVAFLHKLESFKQGQRVVIYRPLFNSSQFHSSLVKNGPNIAMQYVLPIQLVTEDEETSLDDTGRADIVVVSTLNINFVENYMRLSDSISHTMELTPTRDGITVQYDHYKQFDVRNQPIPDDFVLIEDDMLPQEQGSRSNSPILGVS